MTVQTFRQQLFQDQDANRGDRKACFILILFRAAQASLYWPRPLGTPVRVVYRFVADWILGVEIPPTTRVGSGLRLHHAHAVVINDAAVLGSGVELHQGVTIGAARCADDCPRIGDRVRVGTNAILLGEISVGEGARIGAGAVVIGDVPAGSLAVGNPARIVGS